MDHIIRKIQFSINPMLNGEIKKNQLKKTQKTLKSTNKTCDPGHEIKIIT